MSEPEEGASESPGLHRKVTFAFSGTMVIVLFDRAIQIGIMAVLARALAPSAFGVLTASMVFVSSLTLLSQMGVGAVLIQAPKLDERLQAVAQASVFLTGVAAFAIAQLGAPLIGGWFRTPYVVDVIRVLGLSCLMQAAMTIPSALLMRQLRARTLSLIDLIASAFGMGVVAVPMAISGFGYWALIGGALTQTGLRTAMLWALARPSMRMVFSLSELLALWRRGSGFLLNNVLNKIGAEGDRWIVGRYAGSAHLGLYSKASGLMTFPARLYNAAIDRVAFPAFARVQTEATRMRRAYAEALSLTALVGLPLTAALVFLGPRVILLLLGAKWIGAIVPFKILSLAIYFRLADRANISLLKGAGRPLLVSAAQALYGLLVISLSALFIHRGIEAVAWAVALSAVVVNATFTTLAVRTTRLPLRALIPAHLPGVAAALLTIAVLAPITWVANTLGWPPFPTLVAGGAALAATGLLALYIAPRLFLGEAGLRVLRVFAPAFVASR
ncbi:MAG TPA: lipopolysaccharide biosynthesis protein [Caulobacteraceae bacterium]